jgi:hypothetical protein
VLLSGHEVIGVSLAFAHYLDTRNAKLARRQFFWKGEARLIKYV